MKTKGFTLIELLAAIAIIGLLALITVPNVIEKYNSSKLGAMIIQENKLVESGDILVNDYCKDPINKDYQSKCGIYYKQVLDDFDELIITDKDGKVVDKSHDGKKYYRNYICVKDIKTQGYYSENLNYSGEECSGVVIYKMDYETDLQVDSYSYVVCGEEYASNVETGITKGMFSECFPADTPGGGGGDTIPVEKKYKLKVTFTENTPYGMEVSDEVHKQLKKGESINIDVPKYIDWSGNLYTAFIHSYNPSIKNLLEISNGKLKGYMPEEDLEVHIVYSIKKHTLTINFIEFQTNKKMDNSISVEVFNLEPYLVNPKKIDNYKVITPNLEFKIDDNKDASKDVVYQKINFNLTYDEEGGTSCTDGKVPYLGAYPTLCTTTRVGYKFNGWYLGDDGTGTKIKAGDKHNEYKDVTLHAGWTANTYTVTYNCNGGKGTMDSSSHVYGTASALSVNGCDKVGYKFVYWNTKADGTGNRYTDKQKVSTLTSQDKGVVNLYAIYEPRDDTKYTVKHYTQNPNDDGYSLNKTETFQGTTATNVTPSTISITGMIAPSKKSITINPAGDSVLEYKYTRKTYTFNITKNNTYGTVSPNSLILRYGVTFNEEGNRLRFSNGNAVTASPASVTGYDTSFTGWSKTSGTITEASSIEAKFKGTLKTYTITFNVNNSNFGSVSSSSVTIPYGTTYSTSGKTLTFSNGTKINAVSKVVDGTDSIFEKWSSTSGTITGATTITASFKSADTKNPTCTLALSGDNVVINANDDVGVVGTGLSNSSAAIYNGTTYLSISNGTFYGYVKDASGKTGSCQIIIKSTKPSEYTRTLQKCDRTSTGNFVKTSRTCEKVSYYTKETQICNENSSYTKTVSTCKVSTAGSNCQCRQNLDYINKSSSCSGGVACNNICSNAGMRYASGSCVYNYSWSTPVVYKDVVSCVANSPSCSFSVNVGQQKVSCKKEISYSFGEKVVDKNQLSCITNNISCNQSNKGKSKVSCTLSKTQYNWTDPLSEKVTKCLTNSFTCDSSKIGSVDVDCKTDYDYAFKAYNDTSTTCSKTNSFKCDESSYSGTYVSNCKISSYTCDDGYTKFNNSYCYK